MLRSFLLLAWLFLAMGSSPAQDSLRLQLGPLLPPISQAKPFSPQASPSSFQPRGLAPDAAAQLSPSPGWLPSYARENPAGHAYLCRKETEIETSWPVGLWLEAEPDGPQSAQIFSGLRLRVRRYLGGPR